MAKKKQPYPFINVPDDYKPVIKDKFNKRLCLHPLRYFLKCDECDHFLTCESRIVTPLVLKRFEEKGKKKEKIKELKAQIEELKK